MLACAWIRAWACAWAVAPGGTSSATSACSAIRAPTPTLVADEVPPGGDQRLLGDQGADADADAEDGQRPPPAHAAACRVRRVAAGLAAQAAARLVCIRDPLPGYHPGKIVPSAAARIPGAHLGVSISGGKSY